MSRGARGEVAMRSASRDTIDARRTRFIYPAQSRSVLEPPGGYIFISRDALRDIVPLAAMIARARTQCLLGCSSIPRNVSGWPRREFFRDFYDVDLIDAFLDFPVCVSFRRERVAQRIVSIGILSCQQKIVLFILITMPTAALGAWKR